MTALSLIIAPSGVPETIREVLTDWSQAGLLDSFVWVRGGAGMNGAAAHGLEVTAGTPGLIDLERLAGGYDRPDTVRVCAIAPLRTGWASELHRTEQWLAERVTAGFAGVPVARIRLVVARAGDDTRSAGIAAEGWHTVCVSPEDSTGPLSGHAELSHTAAESVDAVHTAAALAGLLGLWRGSGESPFDGREPEPGRVVQLARSFFRRLDAEDIERRLRERVLRVDDALPLPMHLGTQVAAVEDVGLALGDMSTRFWEQHRDLVAPERFPYPESRVQQVTAWQALKMFFGFLGAALKRAPGAWAARVVSKLSSATAGVVAGAVFGNGASAYAVVVNGVRADGTPAHWQDLSGAAAQLAEALQHAGVQQEHYVRDSQQNTWRDYVSAALTLADAEERAPGLPPIQIGANRGVLRRASDIVPTARFTELPRHLAGYAELSDLEAYDVVGVHDLTTRLERDAVDPVNGATASTALAELNAWKQRSGTSFAAYAGARLAQALTTTRTEIGTLLQRILSAADPTSAIDRAKESQRKNARVLLIMLGIAIAVVAAVAVLGMIGIIGMTWMWIAIGGVVLAWAIASLIAFIRGQQQLFHLLNERKDLISQLEVDQQNLRFALRDARRQSDAYEQFLSWSRVLGEVLREPFGRPVDEDDAALPPLAGLPQSVGIGTAVVNEDALANVAYELRRTHFTTGWLTAPWHAALAAAATSIGPRGVELGGDPEAMFAQPGAGPDSLLAAWATQLVESGTPSAAGDAAVAEVLLTAGKRPGMIEQLMAGVTQNGVLVPADRFIADIANLDPRAPQKMNASVLSARGQTTGISAVAEQSLRDHQDGLSRVVCLTQFTAPFPEYELSAFEERPETISWGTTASMSAPPAGAPTEPNSAPPGPGAPSPFDGMAF